MNELHKEEIIKKIKNDGAINAIIKNMPKIWLITISGTWGYYYARLMPGEKFKLFQDVQDSMYPCTCFTSDDLYSEDDVIQDLLYRNMFTKSYKQDKKFEIYYDKIHYYKFENIDRWYGMNDRLDKLYKSINSLESNIICNQYNVKDSIIQATKEHQELMEYFNAKYSEADDIKAILSASEYFNAKYSEADDIKAILSEISSYITRIGCTYSNPISHEDLNLLSDIRIRIFSIKRKIYQYEKEAGWKFVYEWLPPILPF